MMAMLDNIAASCARIDAKLVASVQWRLSCEDVELVEHRRTGVGCQTVPVFRVPASSVALARSLGLTVVEG